MSRFLQRPNLPEGKVTLCVMSGKYPLFCRALEALGVEVLPAGPSPNLPEPVACHGDLQLCHLGGADLLVEPGAPGLGAALARRNFRFPGSCPPAGKEYPADVPLGLLLLAPFCFGNLQAAAPDALEYLRRHGWEPVRVRQGYAKCSTVIAGKGIAITADKGLWEALSRRGIDCLKVEPGDILLDGYDTGFLGGCCGLIAPKALAFTGSLDRYREGEKVQRFLGAHGVRAAALSDGPMIDIGGILPLMEEDTDSCPDSLY